MREDQIDEIGQQQEDNAQSDGDIEVAATRLHDSGRGKNSGITLNITTYHDGGTDL